MVKFVLRHQFHGVFNVRIPDKSVAVKVWEKVNLDNLLFAMNWHNSVACGTCQYNSDVLKPEIQAFQAKLQEVKIKLFSGLF